MKNFKRFIAVLLIIFTMVPQIPVNAMFATPAPMASNLNLEPVELQNGDSIMFNGPIGRGYLIPANAMIVFETDIITEENAYFTLKVYKKNAKGVFKCIDSMFMTDVPSGSTTSIYQFPGDKDAYFAFEIINYSLTPVTFTPRLIMQ